jgi:DNA-binding NarL/FixJ family response regulator
MSYLLAAKKTTVAKKYSNGRATPKTTGRAASKAANDNIGVLVIDDQAVVRVGLRLLLEDTPGMRFVDEAHDLETARAAIAKVQPDVILLDLLMSDERALEFLPELTQAAPAARTIILTCCADAEMHQRAIALGARGLVLKSQPVDVLLKAIRRVNAGELWIERELMHTVIGQMMTQQTARDPEAEKIGALTVREREIVAHIGQGSKNKQIAEKLFISETTVRHHLTSIFSKLEVSDRLELVIYAYQHKLACVPGVGESRS